MIILYIILACRGNAHMFVDFFEVDRKPFNCAKCLSTWLSMAVCGICVYTGVLTGIEAFVTPAITYVSAKIISNYTI